MGNCNFKTEKSENKQDSQAMTKNLFLCHYVVGKGGFGKVQRINK